MCIKINNFRIVPNKCGGFKKQPIGYSRGTAPSIAICDLSMLYQIQRTK